MKREGPKPGQIVGEKEVEVCVREFQLYLVLLSESHGFQLIYKKVTQQYYLNKKY